MRRQIALNINHLYYSFALVSLLKKNLTNDDKYDNMIVNGSSNEEM